ncbi:type II toxin-antitoxin system Phd/YefM family antitoxin [Thermoflexus sp.]|uniref:type II toxin-antitoxin system Phd/YefM family antitoxin n=1 Tax=Thermoflexus sp. TaxID=1969742 RepID=UPI0025D31591|nr:type II toxin-antitoxin system prevent-host-death family antitoxin [Thermoflexus sp.]MDW8064475.1 type II toxin-antitoxin system prevent-host-death family antitoxin [Anaerolineae bacterium]MCS6962425.1 type II toxin-antitoxin system prevent-host-death family antitoxin [Thermoflexus sp.]MCS7351291.1 type II toxin-antitoxin system prevent-host-death family antitoxin [Thermoflexus sp.]MCX7690937.1 type II toxin-antitoxin system prevent-host-death family antitoxin [Thermoflexus sp.]MDW8180745.1
METVVGIRDLKTHLSRYIRQVKAGAILVITERGKPIGRLVPIASSAETRLSELLQAGMAAWSGRKLAPLTPVARARGERVVADLLLEDRG